MPWVLLLTFPRNWNLRVQSLVERRRQQEACCQFFSSSPSSGSAFRLEFNPECQCLSDIHQLNEENQRRMKGIGRYNSTLPIIRQLLCFPPLFSLAFVSPLLQQRDARQCNSVYFCLRCLSPFRLPLWVVLLCAEQHGLILSGFISYITYFCLDGTALECQRQKSSSIYCSSLSLSIPECSDSCRYRRVYSTSLAAGLPF